MVRTQIQLPNELYAQAKRLADHREISLAELVRRGLEAILSQYPDPARQVENWQLPLAQVGKPRVSLEQLYEYARDDEEARSLVAETPDE